MIERLKGSKGGPFPKGTSGNPGGKPSIVKDLERARMIGIPAELYEVLTEWYDEGKARLTELGPDGFVAGLRQAMEDAAARVLPLDLAEARAWWWRTILPVAFAGPHGTKDAVWTYASQEVGVRLLGKPKETLAIEGERTPIDWSKVPEDERAEIGAVLVRLHGYLSESPTEH